MLTAIKTNKDLTLDRAGILVIVDPTESPITITLPLAALVDMQTVAVKSILSGSHRVTIVTAHDDVFAVTLPGGLVSNMTSCDCSGPWFSWFTWSDGQRWHVENPSNLDGQRPDA